MAKTTRRLGRGLDSLISNLTAEPTTQAESAPASPAPKEKKTKPVKPIATKPTERKPKTTPRPSPQKARPATEQPKPITPGTVEPDRAITLAQLPLDAIDPNPYQPRNNIVTADVLSLAASIKQSGVLQPITVRPNGNRYELVAGERRWRAAGEAGLKTIPATIRQATNEEMLELALIENLQREDLNAIDRARAYRRFCDEFSLKADQVAQRMGEDRTTVTNYLRLLDLGPAIQDMVACNTLSMGHARCLLGIDNEADREQLAQVAKTNGLSVRALEEIVRRKRTHTPDDTPTPEPQPRSPHVVDLQRRFEESLKTRVSIIEGRRKGTGRIVIQYFSLDDFDRISEGLGVRID